MIDSKAVRHPWTASGAKEAERLAMAETATVTFTIVGFEPLRDRGRLLAFANIELVIEGVVLKLQGVSVLRERDGTVTCQAPRFRHPDGRWLPAVVLPKELSAAIATEVLATFEQGIGAARFVSLPSGLQPKGEH